MQTLFDYLRKKEAVDKSLVILSNYKRAADKAFFDWSCLDDLTPQEFTSVVNAFKAEGLAIANDLATLGKIRALYKW